MNKDIRKVQEKILEIMKFIDAVCRENDIQYFIMGGTALGAVRHGGFIPWDDDLDIFMTPEEYNKFKIVFNKINSPKYVLQEWKTCENYLEYSKVRMNGTTFIEDVYKDRKDMHHGIYVDIMILHKVPQNKFIQRKIYLESKFVTLYALSQRNWNPKSRFQEIALKFIKILPSQLLTDFFYKDIYKYDDMERDYCYCYWITPAKFKNGLFDYSFFQKPVDIVFEDTILYGSEKIKEYLEYRYGDYMKVPDINEQESSVHALYFDTENDYSSYFL